MTTAPAATTQPGAIDTPGSTAHPALIQQPSPIVIARTFGGTDALTPEGPMV
jgi:hypothetical protein